MGKLKSTWSFAIIGVVGTLFIGSCGVVDIIQESKNWRFADAESKNRIRSWEGSGEDYERPWLRFSYSVTPDDSGIPYADAAFADKGADWRASGQVENHTRRVNLNSEGTAYKNTPNKWAWHGRFIEWHKRNDQNRGAIKSDGWMRSGTNVSGKDSYSVTERLYSYKVADWREYDNVGRILSEGEYVGENYAEDQWGPKASVRAVKHGVWRYPDYENLSIATETWEEGKKMSSGKEPWPDYSAYAGRYSIKFGENDKVEVKIEKSGRVVVEKSFNSWSEGKEFWLYQSPFFRGDVICPNLAWNGSVEVFKIAEGKLIIEKWWPHYYPYEEAVGTIEAIKL